MFYCISMDKFVLQYSWEERGPRVPLPPSLRMFKGSEKNVFLPDFDENVFLLDAATTCHSIKASRGRRGTSTQMKRGADSLKIIFLLILNFDDPSIVWILLINLKKKIYKHVLLINQFAKKNYNCLNFNDNMF